MDRSLLMIPGPIEVEPEVLAALAAKPESHVSPAFIERFGRCLERLREVFRAPEGQPFVVAGSGTLAMELAAVNLIEPGDAVLVVNSGYFSDRYVRLLERCGAQVTQVRAPVGHAPALDEVAAALDRQPFKLLVATHVDTSTGVRVPAQELARLARERDVLSLFDGVCATAGERFEQGAWGADVYLTASQKAVGVPPGLALVMVGPRALAVRQARRAPLPSLYCDWLEWLPIMQAYEARRPAYFATPPVNLIAALAVSLEKLLGEGMEAVWARHARMAGAFRAAWQALGLRLVPESAEVAANTLSAIYYPDGVDGSLVGRIRDEGVIVAGGLHPEIRERYFRVGHMGAVRPNDVLATVGAVERALHAAGHKHAAGAGVAAAQGALVGGDE